MGSADNMVNQAFELPCHFAVAFYGLLGPFSSAYFADKLALS